MPAGHLSCSKPEANRSVGTLVLKGSMYVGLMVTLAGCTTSFADFGSAEGWRGLTTGIVEKIKPVPASKKVAKSKPKSSGTAVTKTVSRALAKSKGAFKKVGTKVSSFAPTEDVHPDSALGQTSSRCRHLLALTGIETKFLRSPTVSTEGDDNGDVTVSLGYDVVDLQRAHLKEELAIAKCKRHNASAKLGSLLITSPQALSRAGYLAKANSLRANSGLFKSIKGQIRAELNKGNLTYQRANLLNQHVDLIVSRESKARGEAARREAVDDVQLQSARGLDQSLVASERRIHDLSRRMRTADAVKLRLSGGYGIEENNIGVVRSTEGQAFAKAKLSIRLGAFDPRRQELEEIAEESRIDGLYEQQTGVFWRAGEIARSNRNALNSLNKQRGEILAAITEARRTSSIRSADYETELMMPRLRARADILALKAELAGVNATIVDTKRIERKLSFR